MKQSTHDIGIRMALGASALSVVLGFVRRGLALGAIGGGLGIGGALVMARVLHSALFGVSATDVTSFVRSLALVLGGVLVGTLLAARRASRTDPLTALRQ